MTAPTTQPAPARDTTPTTERPPAVSVVVPVVERPEPLRELYEEFAAPLAARGIAFEFLFVLAPWHRRLVDSLRPVLGTGTRIRVLEMAQAASEATLVRLAADLARADIVLVLPAYRRVEATALTELLARVEAGADVAVARRWPRRDSWVNRLQHRVLHALVGGLGAGRLHDVASGVHAVRREVLREMPLYGDFFRFLPLFALRDGYRVEEVNSAQHPREARARVYGPGVYLRRIVDVLGLFFLLRFTEKPLRFFGLIGSGFATAGSVLLIVLLIQRWQGQGLAGRPLLLLGVLLTVVGVQAVALGLIGEIIVHLHAPGRRPYRLARGAPDPEP